MKIIRSRGMAKVIFINIIIGILWVLGKAAASAIKVVGNFGFKLPENWKIFGGFVFPGSILKPVLQVLTIPIRVVSDNIKYVLIVDAVIIIILLLRALLSRFGRKYKGKQCELVDEASEKMQIF